MLKPSVHDIVGREILSSLDEYSAPMLTALAELYMPVVTVVCLEGNKIRRSRATSFDPNEHAIVLRFKAKLEGEKDD